MAFSLGNLFGKSSDTSGQTARVAVEGRLASLPDKPDGKTQYLDPAFIPSGSGGFHRDAGAARPADGASVFGYCIELINKGRAPLLNFEAELKVEFVEAIREGDSMRSGKTVLEKPWRIGVPRLDPGKAFAFYLAPIPDRFVRLGFPAQGEAQRPGGGMAEPVEIAVDRPMGMAVGPSNLPKREKA